MEMLDLVVLTNNAALDVVPDETRRLRVEEGGAEAMQSLLDALMPGAVYCVQNMWLECRGHQHEDAPRVEGLAVDDHPLRSCLATGSGRRR